MQKQTGAGKILSAPRALVRLAERVRSRLFDWIRVQCFGWELFRLGTGTYPGQVPIPKADLYVFEPRELIQPGEADPAAPRPSVLEVTSV